jgi:hypothetical protein
VAACDRLSSSMTATCVSDVSPHADRNLSEERPVDVLRCSRLVLRWGSPDSLVCELWSRFYETVSDRNVMKNLKRSIVNFSMFYLIAFYVL